MGLKLPKNAGGDGKVWPVCPEGNHRACIVRVIELGTHVEQKFDKSGDVTRLKVYIVYELLDEDERDDKRGPWVVGRMYTASSYKDAPLMKVITSALGRPIGEDEEPDIETIVGRCVMLNVEHTTKGDKVYENVRDATPVANALRKLPVKPKYPPLYEALGTYAETDWLPRIYGQRVGDVIAASAEMKGRHAGPRGRVSVPDEGDDQDNPFDGTTAGGRKPGNDEDSPF